MNIFALKTIYLLSWIATLAIRHPFEKENKKNKIEKDNRTALEIFVLLLTLFGMMIFPLVYIFTPFFNFANYDLPLSAHILGILLIAPTLWLFYRSHKDLGKNWSVTLEIRKDHTIVDTGVYKHIRHPMYAAMLLSGLIQTLLLNNYLGGLAGFLSFLILYVLRVKQEEDMMLKEFGDSYREYQKKTKKIIPFIY